MPVLNKMQKIKYDGKLPILTSTVFTLQALMPISELLPMSNFLSPNALLLNVTSI